MTNDDNPVELIRLITAPVELDLAAFSGSEHVSALARYRRALLRALRGLCDPSEGSREPV